MSRGIQSLVSILFFAVKIYYFTTKPISHTVLFSFAILFSFFRVQWTHSAYVPGKSLI